MDKITRWFSASKHAASILLSSFHFVLLLITVSKYQAIMSYILDAQFFSPLEYYVAAYVVVALEVTMVLANVLALTSLLSKVSWAWFFSPIALGMALSKHLIIMSYFGIYKFITVAHAGLGAVLSYITVTSLWIVILAAVFIKIILRSHPFGKSKRSVSVPVIWGALLGCVYILQCYVDRIAGMIIM